MDPGPQAYGAGKVGSAFNIQNFVRKPHVFVRLLSLVSKYKQNVQLLSILFTKYTNYSHYIDDQLHDTRFHRNH